MTTTEDLKQSIKRKEYKLFELENKLEAIPGVSEIQTSMALIKAEIKTMQSDIDDIADMEAGCY